MNFRFPLKNTERNQKWLDAVQRKGFTPSKHSAICSDHFVRSDYKINPGGSYRLHLKETAIPSIFHCSAPAIKVLRSDIAVINEQEQSTSEIVMPIIATENSPDSQVIEYNDDSLLVTPSKVKRRLYFSS